MAKQAISVTLRPENLLWLRGRAHARRQRSVSEALDQLVTEARTGGVGHDGAIRSVVGTIRIAHGDPSLSHADAAIRALLPAPARMSVRARAAGRPAGPSARRRSPRG
jgi:hypothetical protein